MPEQRIQDIESLAHSRLLAALTSEEIGWLLGKLALDALAPGTSIEPARQGEPALHFILAGELEWRSEARASQQLGPGDVFGLEALVGRPSSGLGVALGGVRLARLSTRDYLALAEAAPRTAFHLAQGVLAKVLEHREPALAQAAAASVSAPAAPSLRLADLLPAELDGARVVAGRVGELLLSLGASAPAKGPITPVTIRDWEGRDVYRRSAGLVLLEAARRLAVPLRLGPSITSGRLVSLAAGADRAGLAQALNAQLKELIHASLPIEEELWPVPDAIALLREQADFDTCLLLEDSLEPVVTLLRCGLTRAVAPRPLLPHAGLLGDVRLVEHPLGLLLDFGALLRTTLPPRSTSTIALELRAPRYGAPMTLSAAEWLKFLGIESVGSFNQACVSGRVDELIRVSEGFHEKRIAETADQIKARAGVRLVAVAGPSSSGKTTFIKRLLVQLRVNGIEPFELSLDDYYLDRSRQPRGADGEFDFEALESLDLPQLHADLENLLAGGNVRPPRYDFQQGVSRPQAGAELRLGEHSVLLLEGIHALNPALYGPSQQRRTFRVFIHPATSLAFDRLTSLEPADVRLLRRIVRDRHQRGFAAAETLARWPSVRRAERLHIFPFQGEADAVFDSSLIYEVSVLRVYAERYLLEVPRSSPDAPSARRLRQLLRLFVPIHAEHVPPTSLLREFIGGSGFTY